MCLVKQKTVGVHTVWGLIRGSQGAIDKKRLLSTCRDCVPFNGTGREVLPRQD